MFKILHPDKALWIACRRIMTICAYGYQHSHDLKMIIQISKILEVRSHHIRRTWILLLCAPFFLFTACQQDWRDEVIHAVSAMEAFMVETERSGDYLAQLQVYSDQYGYIDVSGNRVGKAQVKERRKEDHKRSLELVATEQEVIPLSKSLAVTRGRWDGQSIYYGGIPRHEPSRYMAVWRRERGSWKLLADQVTPIVTRTISRPEITLSTNELMQFEGAYRLYTNPPVEIGLKVISDTLNLIIDQKLEGLPFFPSFEQLFFAKKRPWELKFNLAKDSIILTSWGIESAGSKMKGSMEHKPTG